MWWTNWTWICTKHDNIIEYANNVLDFLESLENTNEIDDNIYNLQELIKETWFAKIDWQKMEDWLKDKKDKITELEKELDDEIEKRDDEIKKRDDEISSLKEEIKELESKIDLLK